MRSVHFLFFLMIFVSVNAYASDVVTYDPTDPTVPNRVTSYQRSVDTGVYDPLPNVKIKSDPPHLIKPLTSIPDQSVPIRYWKVVGSDAVEMAQTEKDVLDAPILAEQARQQAFTDEISGTTGNDICNAELSVIASKLDTLKAANQADIDAITNVASAKVALTNMNNRYDLVLRRIARCLRARSR